MPDWCNSGEIERSILRLVTTVPIVVWVEVETHQPCVSISISAILLANGDFLFKFDIETPSGLIDGRHFFLEQKTIRIITVFVIIKISIEPVILLSHSKPAKFELIKFITSPQSPGVFWRYSAIDEYQIML
jgi:hypothetical protein